jgi:hypothetical protein
MEAGTLETIASLVQYPIVAAFMWWVWQSNKRQDDERTRQDVRWDENNNAWRGYLTERNSKLEKALEKLATAIDNNKHQA